MGGRGFFSGNMNINREEAEQKLGEYTGRARPIFRSRPDGLSRLSWEAEIAEQTPFQRRFVWILYRVIKLLAAYYLPIIAVGVYVSASESHHLHKGKFEHRITSSGSKIEVSGVKATGEMAVRVISEEKSIAIYERDSSGRWSMKTPSSLIYEGYRKLVTTRYGEVSAYTGAEAERLTLLADPDRGPEVGYAVDSQGNLVSLPDEALRVPAHSHAFSIQEAESTVFISEDNSVLLEIDPIRSIHSIYSVDESRGFLEIDQDAAFEPLLAAWTWGSESRAKFHKDDDAIIVKWKGPNSTRENWARINTLKASYRDFDWSRKRPQDSETNPSVDGVPDSSVYELSASISIAALLLLFFRRDIRLLGRYLGKPMRVGRALLTTGLSTIGARIAYILVIFSIIIPNTVYHEGYDPSRLVVPDFLDVPDEVQQVEEERGNSQFGAICSIGLAPIVEELTFRCVLFLIFLRIFGKFWSVIMTTALFVLAHESVYTLAPIIVIVIGSLGLAMALVLLWTRRLRWSILCHALSNAIVHVACVMK
ncbi:MAG: CPBP family intramembrane metalloprotease [Candidatus Coatesbacteria bacterium]|nr:CPBP family intramembrane metalloprotease [Candidatus Coatesbacteria bacterium]